MSEYTAIILGSVSIMFFFSYVAFRMLSAAEEGDRWHQVASLLVLFGAIVVSWTVAGTVLTIEEALAPTVDLSSSVNGLFWVTVVVGVLLFFYFALRIALGTMLEAYRVNKNRGGGDR